MKCRECRVDEHDTCPLVPGCSCCAYTQAEVDAFNAEQQKWDEFAREHGLRK